MSILGAGTDPNTGNASGVVMNSLPRNVQNRYAASVTFWTAQLTALETLYAKLSLSTLDEYDLVSGDGRTKGVRKNLESVQKQLAYAENRLRFFEQKLYGRGVMILRLRRK